MHPMGEDVTEKLKIVPIQLFGQDVSFTNASLFMVILAFGLAYAWRRGALEWR